MRLLFKDLDRIDNVIDKLEFVCLNVDEELLQELRDIRDDIPCNCGECDYCFEHEESKLVVNAKYRNCISSISKKIGIVEKQYFHIQICMIESNRD